MRSDWDERARDNAYHYIASGREDWDDEEFYASGRESVREILTDDADRVFRGRDPRSIRALEIGCGAGRMTRALAETVGEIHAVDVSAEMVRRAKAAVEAQPNANVYLSDGCSLDALPDSGFQLALSYIVFQHIPDQEVIESYFRDVASRLEPGGVFKLQTQGSPLALLGKQDTWEGCFVSASTWLEWSRRYGYRLFDFEGAGSQYLWLWWERVEDGASSDVSDVEIRFLQAEKASFEELLRSFAGEIQKGEAEQHALRDALDTESARSKQAHEALLDVYRSPAYRIGRRLGLAPKRIG